MGYKKSLKFRTSLIMTLISVLLFSFSFVPHALPQNSNEEQELPSEILAGETAEPAAGTEASEQEKSGPEPAEQLQTEQAPPAIPEKKPVVLPRLPQLQKASATVSFFFDDADIFEVVQTVFGDILKANYIIDPQVKGRVNFRTVTPIPKEEVLSVIEIIFRLNGIGYVEEGGLYRIIPLADVSRELVYSQIGKTPEKVAIEMFTFRNLDLKESMTDIETALGLHLKGGTVRLVPVFRMNALIVIASSREQLDYIKEWAEVFDTMYGIARPKIYVYPLQNSKASHIASLLQSILSGGGASAASPAATPARTVQPRTQAEPGTAAAPAATTTAETQRTGAGTTVTSAGTFVSRETRIFADEITNSLIILAIPSDYVFLEETIKRLDTQPRQVVIEGLIARVDLTDNLSFGFAWSLKTDVNIKDIKPFNKDINLDGDVFSRPFGTTFDRGAGDGFTFVATDPSGIVRARLTAALKDSRAKILAAPHILVSDNREARIQVGSQIPLATSTTTTPLADATNTTTATIQYKDIGIILKVKPQINDSGLVSLEITQEVSSQGDNVSIAGSAFASINKTEATTDLVAQDGQTIVIGGLIREDATRSKDGIPFLSKIPLLGYLFSNTSRTSTRTELIILLTPHVVKSQTEAGKLTSDYIHQFEKTSRDRDIKEFIEERRMQKEGEDTDSGDAGE
jgi:type II secretion system protein D